MATKKLKSLNYISLIALLLTINTVRGRGSSASSSATKSLSRSSSSSSSGHQSNANNKLSSIRLLEAHPSINLIPVDRPVTSATLSIPSSSPSAATSTLSSSSLAAARHKLEPAVEIESINDGGNTSGGSNSNDALQATTNSQANSLHSTELANQPNLNLEASSYHTFESVNNLPDNDRAPNEARSPRQQSDDFAEFSPQVYARDEEQQQQQQQQQQILVSNTPEHHQSVKGQPLQQELIGDGHRELLSQELVGRHPNVERRFGLFKKNFHSGQHQPQQSHFGAPLTSANYLAPFMMTDCERCLAGLNVNGGPPIPSGELQQLEPTNVVPLPAPTGIVQPPPPPPIAGPVYGSGQHAAGAGGQPFGPLKSKLFMKFPFFVKPSLMNFGSLPDFGAPPPALQPTYWQHQHHYASPLQPLPAPPPPRPTPSGALYLRPASAYNCVQASAPSPLLAPPPLVSPAQINQEITSISKVHHNSPSANIKSGHQFHQQQQQQQQQTQYSSNQY